MNRAIWVGGCVLAGGGALALWWLREPEVDAAAPTPVRVDEVPWVRSEGESAVAESPASASSAPQGSRTADSTGDADASPDPDPDPDYAARLRDSKDYWRFAEDVIGAARRGDPAAQFHLSSALTYCESLYDWYFIVHLPEGKVRHRTLDEALALTATRPVFTPDDVRDIQSRCQKLRGAHPPPFGTAREWRDAALAAAYPEAQALAALDKALLSRDRGDPQKAGIEREEARRLAVEALRTRDPRVMTHLGDVAANLAADDPAESRKVQWVWPLAACLREPDCAAMKDWMRLFCNIDGQCQPFETPVDIIRRRAGNDYDEVERRARELNEKLDAGNFGRDDL